MADTVDSLVVFSGKRKYVVRLTNISDGTGESGVTKVDRSTLTGPNGANPELVVEKIEYVCDGMQVRLFWDDGTDDEIAVLSGSGFLDWTEAGGLNHPQTPGDATEGDILLTTNAHTAGDAYNITLYLRLR